MSGVPAARLLVVLVALVSSAVGCARTVDPLPGFGRASGEDSASLVRAVGDYYTVRGRAFVTGDVRSIYAAYPQLAEGENVREGINLDAFHLRGWREVEATSVTHELERYEPMRMYISGDKAVVFVHGLEWFEIRGGPSGGEFFTRIDLVRDAGRWVVERTDEQMMAEPRPRVPTR